MSLVTDHIKVITTKLQQLLRQYDHLLKENNKQLQLITQLQQEQQASKVMLEHLQQQNLLLKASFTSMDEKDKKELEQKIKVYLKNIDKCISLLSQ